MSDIDKTSMRVVLDQFDRTFLLPLVADVKQVWEAKRRWNYFRCIFVTRFQASKLKRERDW